MVKKIYIFLRKIPVAVSILSQIRDVGFFYSIASVANKERTSFYSITQLIIRVIDRLID